MHAVQGCGGGVRLENAMNQKCRERTTRGDEFSSEKTEKYQESTRKVRHNIERNRFFYLSHLSVTRLCW